ncbi:MAG: (Fe-S)-binding protein, partial [Anaerolineae bacterium]
MALSGIQIYKLLPQTNCKECDYPTCLAFAMKLAAKQAELDDCPYVSDEAREELAESAAPPIRLVTLSADGRKAEAGNEIVLFRHEKRFYNPAGIFIRVYDDQPLDEIKAQTDEAMSYEVEYVGMDLGLDGMAVQSTGGGEAFAEAIEAVLETAQVPLILIADDPDVMRRGLEAVAGDVRPLIYGATADNWEAFADLAKEHDVPMAIRAETMSALADMTEKIKEAGITDMVLDPGVRDLRSSLALNTLIRRL